MRRHSLLIAIYAAAVLAACGDNHAAPGAPDAPSAEDCGAAGDEDGNGTADCDDPACVDAPSCQPACGNGKREAGEACDDGNAVDGDNCDSNCTPTGCGNGVMSTGELCDDGNAVDGDNCDSNCMPSGCGNGVVTAGELCDDGNAVDGDNCDSNCTPTACGNGIMTAGETCDDGNAVDGDNCDSNCTPTGCGNGVMTAGELCDDGNAIEGDNCDSNCTPTGCGNGVMSPGELCDDGNAVNGDSCDSNCTPTGCGNGIMTAGEICDDGNLVDGDNCDSNCTPTGCGNGILNAGETCDDGNTANWDGCASTCTSDLFEYIKASNTGDFDSFAIGIALSADGSTLAVGATGEDSAATGIDGNQASNTAAAAGAVYVFTRSGATWVQQAYLKASNTGAGDAFGNSLALSADGSTLAVGAKDEDSAATGIDGNQADNTATSAGAVYVFTRSGAVWSQQAYLKASNTGAGDVFGLSVSLAADGSTLAVGARDEDSAATGIGGNEADNAASNAGAVYVFSRAGTAWSQAAYLKASNTNTSDQFGAGVALSGDASTLAVGAPGEDSAATGIDGNQASNAASGSGAVYVFTRSGTTWTQQAYVKQSNTGAGAAFGGPDGVSLSNDGSTMVVGAPTERSAATGIDGNQADSSLAGAGAVYVFERTGTGGTPWSQRAYIKSSNTNLGDIFGRYLGLSGDGATLAVSAANEDSSSTGFNGNQADNSITDAGAVYIFERTGNTWSQRVYIKAPNTSMLGFFGNQVKLSTTGTTLAIGAIGDHSMATGINGNMFNLSYVSAGAVFMLH